MPPLLIGYLIPDIAGSLPAIQMPPTQPENPTEMLTFDYAVACSPIRDFSLGAGKGRDRILHRLVEPTFARSPETKTAHLRGCLYRMVRTL